MPSRASAIVVLLLLMATVTPAQPPGEPKAPANPPERAGRPVDPAQPPVDPKATDKTAKPADKPAAKVVREPEFDVAFADSSNIKVVLLEQSVALTTKYGKLEVPIADVRKVEFGFRYPEGVEAKVTAAIEKLAAPAFLDREEAGKALLELKDYAAPHLTRALKDANPERRTRAEGVLKLIRPSLPDDRVNVKDFDTIETTEFTIRGRLEPTTFKARTKQFGDAVVKLAEVKTLKAVGAAPAAGEIAVDAAKYAKLNWSAWFDTGTDVTAGQPLEITATGKVDQWPQEPGRYTSGPAGNGTPAQGAPFAVRQQFPRPAGFGPDGRPFGQLTSGQLVGKIGETGQPFVVGESLKLPNAPQSGKLFLLIAPSHWGNDNCAGEYKVRVTVGAP